MKRFLVALMAVMMLVVFVSCAVAEQRPAVEKAGTEEPEFEPLQLDKNLIYNGKVVILQLKLKALGFDVGPADGLFGKKTEKCLKALQEEMGLEQTGVIASQEKFDQIMNSIRGDGVNLVKDSSSEWSDWMIPKKDANNRTFDVAVLELGEKQVDDPYTCQIEIEFAGVSATQSEDKDVKFRFVTQGSVDGSWGIGNIWNKSLVSLAEVPADGVYKYTVTSLITPKNVDATAFNLGFRCDYWASGQFRVRCIKVEKGNFLTEWSK